jgi:glyoxylase-like metal-dependent hydrolase (beta-lactamase superfamily II)
VCGVIPVADDVWQLPLTPRDAINAYLIGDVLVDTGITQSADKIAGMLEGRQISAIALTHAHNDHAGAMKRLADRLGVPVWCGTRDREAAETGRVVLAPAFARPRLNALIGATAGFEAAPVARTLEEGDSLAAGFTVLDTPGHSPGHVSFWREADRTLICGDVFFNMHLLTTIPGLRQPPTLFTTDPAENRRSERRLAALEPSHAGFGHGPVLRGDAAARMREFVQSLPAG